MDVSVAQFAMNTAQATNARAGLDPVRARDDRAARQAAESFEAVFLAQMLQHMTNNVGNEALFASSHSESIYRSMLNDQYAEEIAKRGGIGIADAVYREILKAQEA
ncbi:MAG: hypothetical protein D6763_10845 [Alphaproteobacteria bacterium]|nr:MAG: hypothetical protein D6763_10845 [Alphaproteobacteria bacterium]